MLRGKLTIERADNGVVLEWYEGREMAKRTEVFETSGAAINRLAAVVRLFELDDSIPITATVIPAVEPGSADALADALRHPLSVAGEE